MYIEFLIFGLLSLAVVCLWVLIEGRKKPKFLGWFIPVMLVLITSTYFTYDSILGLPRDGIPKKGIYLSHYIDEPRWIYLWVLEEDLKPKAFRLIYSRKTHQSLEGVRGESEAGKYMMLGNIEEEEEGQQEESEGGKKGGGYTIGGAIEFYEWDSSKSLPRKQ